MRLFDHELNEFHNDKWTDKLSIRGLAKLLMYGNFVQARAVDESRTVKEVMEQELDLYPYSRKKEFMEPYFAPIDLNTDRFTHFKPSLTDAGICYVYNGDSISSSFATSTRTHELQYSLDPRQESIKPGMINGTGKISQKTMWLDAGNKERYVTSFVKEGSLMVAINGWQTYFDVRINQLDLRAGTEVNIKVKPVVHDTSADFKRLSLDDRKCRFMDEVEVCIKSFCF